MSLTKITRATTITIGDLADWRYHWWRLEIEALPNSTPPAVVGRIIAAEAHFLWELKTIYDYPDHLFDELKASPKRVGFAKSVLDYRARWLSHQNLEFTKKVEAELAENNVTDPVNRFHI